MKTGCRIVKDIKRPEKTLVDQFAGVAVANLDDCMGRMSAVHEDIVPVNKTRLLGTAFTVKNQRDCCGRSSQGCGCNV